MRHSMGGPESRGVGAGVYEVTSSQDICPGRDGFGGIARRGSGKRGEHASRSLVRRRRGREDSATSGRCACGPSSYPHFAIKPFYSRASALRFSLRSGDAPGPPDTTPGATPAPRGERGRTPNRLRQTTRSDGHFFASRESAQRAISRSRPVFHRSSNQVGTLAWTMHESMPRRQAARCNRRIAAGVRRREARL